MKSPRHNANAENPELDDARPAPVGNELVELTSIPKLSMLVSTEFFPTLIFSFLIGS